MSDGIDGSVFIALGLALGWLFSSSVFVNNSVKVVANAFDFDKSECEEERNVSATT